MKNLKVISLVMGLMVLSACGSQSSRDLSLSSTNNNTSNPVVTPTPDGNTGNLDPAFQQMVQLSGANGGAASQTFHFDTSRTLKVKVEALPAPHLTVAPYTNWVFAYGCMRVNVTVNGSTRTSKILRIAGSTPGPECQNAPSSDTLDFSNVTTGSSVTVTFSDAQYDNCRYYYYPSTYGCGMQAVWQNHQAAFNATVQTDGTYMQ